MRLWVRPGVQSDVRLLPWFFTDRQDRSGHWCPAPAGPQQSAVLFRADDTASPSKTIPQYGQHFD